MSDIATLEQQIGGAISAASDEAALESVRVVALGKSGSVSALLKTLGSMTPDERKAQGPLINGLKDRVTAAIAARREALKARRARCAAQHRNGRRDAAGARVAGGDRAHSPGEPGDG